MRVRIRRRPVKVWQVIVIAGVVVAVFLVLALMQSNYNVPYHDDPFSQAALEKIQSLAGTDDDLYACDMTYNDSEDETFVVSLSSPGNNGRRQNWNLICFAKDGQMPYRMEKKDTPVSIPEGAVPLSGLFDQMRLFRSNRQEVFGLFEKEKKVQKGESVVQLDLRDRFGETDLLTRRVSPAALTEASSQESAEETPKPKEEDQAEQGIEETRIALTEEIKGISTVTVSKDGVEQAAYQPGDCGENSFLLYRSSLQEKQWEETLLAVVNLETKE